MKKMRITVLIFAIFVGILTGCGEQKFSEDEGKYHIVCTIFPEYDWLKNVIGEDSECFEIDLLIKNGTDLHSYQPTAEDMATIADCDFFVYVGGESATWVDDALKNVRNQEVRILNLSHLLEGNLQEEEHVEGMQDTHHHHDESCEEEHDHYHEEAYDEHVWLSLKNAKVIVEELCRIVSEMDAAHAERYEKNAEAYVKQITQLDQCFEQEIGQAKKDTILVADRFPFLYMVKDYDLEYYAAFSGCSAETEASFETITFLMEKVEMLDLSTILVIENSDDRLAKTVAANAGNPEIRVLNSLQSISESEMKQGASYLEIMRENLEVLKAALN